MIVDIQNLLSDERDPIVWWAALPKPSVISVDEEDAPPFKQVGELNANTSGIGQLSLRVGAGGRFGNMAIGKLSATYRPRLKQSIGPNGSGTLKVTLSFKNAKIVLPDSQFSGGGTLTAVATQAAWFTGGGTLTRTFSIKMPVTPGIVGAGTMSLTFIPKTTFPASQIFGSGTLSVTAIGGYPVTAAFSGDAGLGPGSPWGAGPKALFSGEGTLSAVVRSRLTAPFAGSGTLSTVSASKVFANFSGGGTAEMLGPSQSAAFAILLGTSKLPQFNIYDAAYGMFMLGD